MEEMVQKRLRMVFEDESLVFDKSRFAGGLTNYNYIMNIKGVDYVIRQPGGMTNEMIDRNIEKVNNSIASDLGLNSQCIYFDEHTGVKISLYIENSKDIAVSNPCAPQNIRAVSDLLKKLHHSPQGFPNHFDWTIELTKYEQLVKDLNGDLFYDYNELKNRLQDLVQKNIKNTISVPCHNDTVPENFIVQEGSRAYLVDWEYAGMNDPSWDIAAYILESKLTQEAIENLLMAYYGELPTPEEIIKIKCYMLAQDILWTVWALVRHYNGDDFLDYCYLRYERFRRNMQEITSSLHYPLAEMVRG